jgi:hypothetical protein
MSRLAAFLLLALVVARCGGTQAPTPTATQTVGPQVLNGPYPLSGVVSESASRGGRPMAGVSVNAWIDQGTVGYSYWYAHGPVITGAGGHYQLPGLPDSAHQAWKDERGEYVLFERPPLEQSEPLMHYRSFGASSQSAICCAAAIPFLAIECR